MLFYAYEFVFVFLPVALAGYALARHFAPRAAILWLVLASLFFYGWWNWSYLALIGASILGNYVFGKTIGRTHSRALLAAGITVNLTLLGYYKYAGFFAANLDAAFGVRFDVGEIVLPLAISFFTFQQIAYLVDSYYDKTVPHGLADYALFVCFFPQLIAGPIVHQAEMLPQFREQQARALKAEDLAVGLTIFSIGLFKKLVLADSLAEYANPAFEAAFAGSTLTFAEAWGGTFCYAFQLYFDFSGYCDMAIGLGRLFGIRLPLNFDSPYKSTNIIEFWRRWHMTLSRFLRDYLYFPLGGNRHGHVRRYVNVMMVMTLGGLWHGAAWTFVFWGALHGLYVLLNYTWHALRRALGWQGGTSLSRLVARAITLLAVIVAWVPFRAESWPAATAMLKAMAGFGGIAVHGSSATVFGGLAEVGWIVAGLFIVLALPNTQELMRSFVPAYEPVGPAQSGLFRTLAWRPTVAWALAAGILFTTATFTHWPTDRTPDFIYFNF